MEKPALGEREVDVLHYVSRHAPVAARAVAEHFEETQGLARTTVTTLIERLRKKGYLARRREKGIYRYSPRVPQSEVMQGLVRHFIERTLGGSVSPLFAYLARTRQLSEEEMAELQHLVEAMRAGKVEDA
jgi:predicted transcriptional regulator